MVSHLENISFSGSRYTVYAMHNALQYESYKFRVVEGATESDVVQFITRKLQLKKTKQKTSQFGIIVVPNAATNLTLK